MASRINGAAFAHQNLTENLQYYIVYAKSPNAVSDPENASGVNILVTGDYKDVTQKNFEVLLMSVGLRAMPVVMNEPCLVNNLELSNAPTLFGEGYIWKFAVERADYFQNTGPRGTISPVGFLIDEIHGIVLPNGVMLETTGPNKNIEFVRESLWEGCKPITTKPTTLNVTEKPKCESPIKYGFGKKGK